jgi:SAM-dependent methyltransferase
MRSPVSGRELRPESADVLSDGAGERWPVLGGIAYLRVGREELVARALERLDAGDADGALVALLGDQDDWASTPPPSEADRRAALTAPTLREAMRLLGFGPVGDYFAFRWSDPTFLSGLGLLAVAAPGRERAFELACGIGHFLRELERRGVHASGGDVVFAKLWLARRFVTSTAQLVCFDAAAPFPVQDGSAELALCHDALHYLPDQAHALAELRRIVGREGAVVCGHVHNAAVESLSPGAPRTIEEYDALVPGARLFDDAAVGRALLAGDLPAETTPELLADAPAVAFVTDGAPRERRVGPDFSLPPAGSGLRLNPLLEASGDDPLALRVRWPSERYEREYAALSPHLREPPPLPRAALERAAEGTVGRDPEVDRLARARVLLDLPEAW